VTIVGHELKVAAIIILTKQVIFVLVLFLL